MQTTNRKSQQYEIGIQWISILVVRVRPIAARRIFTNSIPKLIIWRAFVAVHSILLLFNILPRFLLTHAVAMDHRSHFNFNTFNAHANRYFSFGRVPSIVATAIANTREKSRTETIELNLNAISGVGTRPGRRNKWKIERDGMAHPKKSIAAQTRWFFFACSFHESFGGLAVIFLSLLLLAGQYVSTWIKAIRNVLMQKISLKEIQEQTRNDSSVVRLLLLNHFWIDDEIWTRRK